MRALNQVELKEIEIGTIYLDEETRRYGSELRSFLATKYAKISNLEMYQMDVPFNGIKFDSAGVSKTGKIFIMVGGN